MNIGLFDAGHVHLVSFFLEPCADLLWFAPKPRAVESYVLQGLLNGPLCSWHWTVSEGILKSHKQVHKQGMFTFFFFFFWHFFKYYLVTALCWLDMDAKAKESVRKIIEKIEKTLCDFWRTLFHRLHSIAILQCTCTYQCNQMSTSSLLQLLKLHLTCNDYCFTRFSVRR